MTEREALKRIAGFTLSQFMGPHDMALECVNVARDALAQPEQEPVAWPVGWVDDGGTVFWKDKPPADGADLYTTPPQPEQEPVATYHGSNDFGHEVVELEKAIPIGAKLYTTPPQRKPLTDEEIDVLVMDSDGTPNSHLEFARAIEAKIKEKNT